MILQRCRPRRFSVAGGRTPFCASAVAASGGHCAREAERRRCRAHGSATPGATAPAVGSARSRVAQASSVAVLSGVAALLGLGAGLGVWFFRQAKHSGSKDARNGHALAHSERVLAEGFVHLRATALSSVFAHCGSTAPERWRAATLRLRSDCADMASVDAAATRHLGQRAAPAAELVALDAASYGRLLGKAAPEGDKLIPGLRVADGAPPAELCEGAAVTVELTPGCGIMQLYGRPSAYSVQDNSQLHCDDIARAGGYTPQDLYSGRPDRLRRALAALAEQPNERLRVHVDCGGEDVDGAVANFGGKAGLAGILAAVLESPGSGVPLLANVTRAQCCAIGSTEVTARELWDVLYQRAGWNGEVRDLLSDASLEAALARGFWTLPADDSGMSMREREGERLLERARRELWAEGSASREELEKQIRKFLTLHLLGRAALGATLRLRLARPAKQRQADAEQQLRELGYQPTPTMPDVWSRLDLALLEISPRRPAQ